MKVLWVAKRHYQSTYRCGLHYHPFYHYIYLVSGSGTIQVGETMYELCRHTLYPARRMQPHLYMPTHPNGIHTIEIKFDASNDEFAEALDRLPGQITDESGDLKAILDRVIWEGVHCEPCFERFIGIKLEELAYMLIRSADSRHDARWPKNEMPKRLIGSAGNRHLDGAIAYIEENFEKPIVLEQLAGIACYNASYFCKLFRSEIGTSPIHYLIDTRIEKAKELFRETEMTVSEVAYSVGFDSIHYFSRCFSGREGTSPGKYRRELRANIFIHIEQKEELLNGITDFSHGSS